MFIDLDECITDDDSNNNEPFNIYSCIRDVKFSRNAEKFTVHRVNSIFIKSQMYTFKRNFWDSN